jgi:hypothetical protein
MFSTQKPWSLLALAFGVAALAIGLSGALALNSAVPDVWAVGLIVALICSVPLALLGLIIGVVGLFRREGASSAIAMAICVAATLPAFGWFVVGVLTAAKV